ncbi:translation initiation factor 1 (eIF-1/SUI1) [Sinobacterium caligoides]|uniref:Translation initiation factor 1 (eIF-1/SUI1) n=1 Tax=Sinobacterium caligoides TaxID=933926 RepID=A0A3N2E024_9GAMM|nr:translation initiation factor Sui1 [Sinobacterium caligoides]ROS05262.1 translation initiation factor 1 (eIF-1/SUI1) [Sinobacterium caligoides]
MSKNSRLVFSTDSGRHCPKCEQRLESCSCSTDQVAPSDGIVRISRDTKGRKGKGVSIITGIPMNDTDLKKLAKQLKQLCGCGGSVKNQAIEMQTDQREKLKTALEKAGFKVKLAGG